MFYNLMSFVRQKYSSTLLSFSNSFFFFQYNIHKKGNYCTGTEIPINTTEKTGFGSLKKGPKQFFLIVYSGNNLASHLDALTGSSRNQSSLLSPLPPSRGLATIRFFSVLRARADYGPQIKKKKSPDPISWKHGTEGLHSNNRDFKIQRRDGHENVA